MPLMAQSNPPFMSGVPELLLLRLLDQNEMYGYELVRSVRKATGEAISLGEGVIYPVLHGLERGGALRSRRRSVGGRTRVYYSLTRKGRQRLTRLQNDWRRVQRGISNVLETPAGAPA
jgi:PadR family transcriptional regulator